MGGGFRVNGLTIARLATYDLTKKWHDLGFQYVVLMLRTTVMIAHFMSVFGQRICKGQNHKNLSQYLWLLLLNAELLTLGDKGSVFEARQKGQKRRFEPFQSRCIVDTVA